MLYFAWMVCEEEKGFNDVVVVSYCFTYLPSWEGLLPISSSPAFCCNCRSTDHLSLNVRLLRSLCDYSATLPYSYSHAAVTGGPFWDSVPVVSVSTEESYDNGLFTLYSLLTSTSWRPSNKERGVALVSSEVLLPLYFWSNNAQLIFYSPLTLSPSGQNMHVSSWHLYTARSNALEVFL